jgi:peptide/nickel transport system permease protein
VTRYILQRLAFVVPVLLGMSLVVFVIMSLIPGDPALAILGPYATDENLARLRAELDLDKPGVQRYLLWLGDVLQGDLGRSVTLERPVIDEVVERLGPTLLLAGSALALATCFGLAAGIVAALYHRRWPDRAITVLVLLGISTPSFWLALLLMLIFSVWLGWLPVSGMLPAYGEGGAVEVLRHLALPAISLALVAGGVIARLTRGIALEVLSEPFVRMARARGLRSREVITRHVLKNVVARMIPVIGLQAGFVLGGAVYIETVFQWPGVGRMLVDAIASRDLLLVQGGVLVIGAGYMLVNLLTDILQHWMDPRIRL